MLDEGVDEAVGALIDVPPLVDSSAGSGPSRRPCAKFGRLVELESKYDPDDLLHGNARVAPIG